MGSIADDYQFGKKPRLLVLYPPPIFTAFEQEFAKKFSILKPYESPLPMDIFLTTHAQCAKALLCSRKGPATAEVIRLLPSLQLVVTSSTGLNHINLAECRRRGIMVANSRNVLSEDVADFAVGLMLDALRGISAADRFVRSGLWAKRNDFPLGSRVGDRRVGIVGMGSIGYEVAKRLKGFGCTISYNSRKEKPVPHQFYPSMTELAANSDVLIICCALHNQTRHLINKDVMLALGKDGIIINVARGAIIDEKELVRCLMAGEIGGAGLDVFENEPNVPNELLALDNVVLSSHQAAWTEESFYDAFQIVMRNLEAFFANKPLLTPVTDEMD